MGAVVAMTQSTSRPSVKPESVSPGPPRQVSGPGVTRCPGYFGQWPQHLAGAIV